MDIYGERNYSKSILSGIRDPRTQIRVRVVINNAAPIWAVLYIITSIATAYNA